MASLMDTPLPGAWTLWFYHRDKTVKFNNYLAGTHQVLDFSTPASFWRVFSHLAPITALSLWSEYQIFRKDVKPMWEDPHNAQGGRWTLRLKRVKAPKVGDPNYDYQQKLLMYIQDQAPYRWEQLLLNIVSGSFSKGQIFDDLEVLGVVISVRRAEYVISVWNRTATDAAIINALRDAILKVCEASESEVHLEYSPHAESLTKVAERTKVRPGAGVGANHVSHTPQHHENYQHFSQHPHSHHGQSQHLHHLQGQQPFAGARSSYKKDFRRKWGPDDF